MLKWRYQMPHFSSPLRYFSPREEAVRRGVLYLKAVTILFLILSFTTPVYSVDLTLDQIIQNIQTNQSKIKDMYAETVTTITSNMAMPGQEGKGPQKMIQKGKMWTKGSDKSKIEMLSPMKQTTVTNGDQMAIINPETGQKMIQDLKKMREKSGMPDSSKQMSLEKAKEFFDLSIKSSELGVGSSEDGTRSGYIITGVPKKENKFLGKMEFYVRELKSPEALSEGGWVPVKNSSNVSTPAGSMKVEMEFSNVNVNQGIKDSEFKI